VRPRLVTYAEYTHVMTTQLDVAPIADVLKTAEKFFKNAKATIDKALHHDALTPACKAECKSLARVAVANAVFIAASAVQQDLTAPIDFNFSAHKQFPCVIKRSTKEFA